MKTKLFVGALFAIATSSAAMAQPYQGYGPGYGSGMGPRYQAAPPGGMMRPRPGRPAATAAAENPAEVLKAGVNDLLEFVGQSPRPAAPQVAAFLDQAVAPHFDFQYMAQSAAGPLYRQMDAAQRARLVDKLKKMFLVSLAARLAEFDQQQVVFLPPGRVRGNFLKLSIAVKNPGGYPAKIDFRVRRGDAGWKVVDVSANGNSALAFYRSYFRQAMGSGRRGYSPTY
ncbi:MAG: ABC transporter substrate-binding protein [Pseudomonadota bacterium]